MATQPDFGMDDDDDVTLLEGGEPANDDTDDGGDEEGDRAPQGDGDGEDVDVVTFGGGAVEGEDEPEGVRNLRQALKEERARRKQLEERIAPKEDIGARPTLEDCDFDEDAHAEAVEKWVERKRAADNAKTAQEAVAQKQQERWQAQSRDLDSGYGDLRAPGKDVARATVEDTFPAEQFAYLVKAAGKNAPGFIFALGNSSTKRDELKALASEGSWAEFIAAAAVMAKEVQVQRGRRPATQPEEQHRGGTGAAGGRGDAKLARLEAEAERTGDRTALIAHRAALRKAGKL